MNSYRFKSKELTTRHCINSFTNSEQSLDDPKSNGNSTEIINSIVSTSTKKISSKEPVSNSQRKYTGNVMSHVISNALTILAVTIQQIKLHANKLLLQPLILMINLYSSYLEFAIKLNKFLFSKLTTKKLRRGPKMFYLVLYALTQPITWIKLLFFFGFGYSVQKYLHFVNSLTTEIPFTTFLQVSFAGLLFPTILMLMSV